MTVPVNKTLVVVGGGAAGFFCAINAARLRPGLKVFLLEKTNKLLSKVRVSGGGRCNVTHACFDIRELSMRYPRGTHFVRKAFHRFFTENTIEWFAERDVQLKTESDGRMFPVTDNSQTIVECLLREASRYNIDIRLQTTVEALTITENNQFLLRTDKNSSLTADYVCIACGGYPRSSMFDWLRAIGHTIEEPVPSLFTFNVPNHPITALMGVSVPEARVRISGSKLEQTGPVLITHWGFSGPAVLRTSAWGARDLQKMNYHFTCQINWLGDKQEQLLREEFQQYRHERAAQKLVNKNPWQLPQRLWEFMLQQCEITPDTRWADLPAKAQNKLIKELVNSEFNVTGKTTFKEEFVTAGGIKLSEIDPQTMMSRKLPNLFFAGEIMDVDGITGGFNFQHAWTSGWIAANSIAADTDLS
ncbi:NAD(P)/FAD-dependent oxidoreductase [Terrimonas ferruginea]|uniref:NAD(P)/FAD-dependent oxidoreductase n=1 Tax=Terrimonas ferruginea TaxID=249 RepID=UPI0004110471|nr:NAD(P)/FAD-dependent oxidoreductase [Terrimonas ferruginea]